MLILRSMGKAERNHGIQGRPIEMAMLYKVWLMGKSSQRTGRMASWQIRPRKIILNLPDVEFRVSSQWRQGGIIDGLIEKTEIPPSEQTFIESGVETYCQCDTRFLLLNRNWRGLILDGNPALTCIPILCCNFSRMQRFE